MIKGSCFNLRHVVGADVPRLVALLNHPDSKGEYLPADLLSPGAAEKKYEAEALSKEAIETFLLVDDGDAILGRVFHFKTVPYFNSREIGYAMFDTAQRGKGIMREAVQLLTDYLFNTLLVNRLEIRMHVDNAASEKIALRCGYQKEGVARGALFVRGKHADLALYALLRREWEQRAVS
jgi:ribosomal-protein-alanine N-acetyltransferase